VDFDFAPSDWLLFGRESDGLPAEIQASADARLHIPMLRHNSSEAGGVRSLNLSVSVGIVLFEALRQLGGLDNSCS
jgi:tRNA (cytidine/uridine-2'-O-)-methyltransferase